ncbi:MAG: zinc ribbon domain-containing protein [Anaerolineae bacterium]|nr:zinc ribbon domain-containing protein [Gemmatimonadaceae bacterium]
MSALIIGTVLALGALAFVLHPLFVEREPVNSSPKGSRVRAASEEALSALREVEFDRETGKLSDTDYVALKSEYTQEALTAMRAESQPEVSDATDDAEAIILMYRQRLRECAKCGPRPEVDANYCSSCGSFLAGACGSCGARITESGARFCLACGKTIAA